MGVAAFLGISFLFTWSLLPWARTSTPIGLLALFGPAVGALVVSAAGGKEALAALGTRLLDWRCRPRWYLFALGVPVVVSLLRSALEFLWGAPGPVEPQAINSLALIVAALVIGEELGWRGYLLPQLQRNLGPWQASTLIGLAWAAWHLPLFYMPGMPQFGRPFPAFIGYTIALSVLLTALAGGTRGSVLLATCFHAAVNTLGFVNTAATPSLRGWSDAASYGLAALFVGMLAWPRPRRARGG